MVTRSLLVFGLTFSVLAGCAASSASPSDAGNGRKSRTQDGSDEEEDDDTTTTTKRKDGGASDSGTALDGKPRVFVTAKTYNGDLNGVGGAHEKCRAEAEAAGLTTNGFWKAWISSKSLTAKFIVPASAGYELVDGTLVTTDPSAGISKPINLDAAGKSVASGCAWTGTDAAGDSVFDDSNDETQKLCANWNSGDATASDTSSQMGWYSTVGETSGFGANGGKSCAETCHLYCFEVE